MLERPVQDITPNPHIETTLRVLEARPAGADRWRARCPAHGSKTVGALSLAVGTDGRILLHCFAGCTVPEILAAAGLSWGDVFGDATGRRPSLAQAAEAGSNRIFDANMKRARLIAPGALLEAE